MQYSFCKPCRICLLLFASSMPQILLYLIEALCLFCYHGKACHHVLNLCPELQMVNPSKSLYSTEQAIQWLTEIAEALQYMHSLTPAVSLLSRCVVCGLICFLHSLFAVISESPRRIQLTQSAAAPTSLLHQPAAQHSRLHLPCPVAQPCVHLQVVHRDLKLENILLSK